MEYLYVNAKIYTLTGDTATSMFIKNGRIFEIGTYEKVSIAAGPDVEVIDLKGKCVIPGFIDSHCHLLNTGEFRRKMDLSKARSELDLIAIGKKYIEENRIPEGEPVLGFGFNQNLFDIPKLPERELADAISTKHPVLLKRICGHVGTVNSFVYDKLQITKETRFEGGELGIRSDGNFDGLIWENALMEIERELIKRDVTCMRELILEASQYVNSLGITSIHSNDVGADEYEVFMETCKKLENEGNMTVRIYEEYTSSNIEELNRLLKQGIKTGDGTDFLSVGNIKIFADGSLGAHSAAMIDEYSDMPGEKGIAIFETQNQLNDLVRTANEAGLQVAIHAIGDLAATQCVKAFEYAKSFVEKDLRNRIVHCQIADDALLKRMVVSNISADIQPPFTITDWAVAEKAFGDRCLYSYRWKTMRDMGIHIGGGSDSPVESFDPIWGIHCAVNRCNSVGEPHGGWHPTEKLNVLEAVELYTRDGAYLAFEEESKGTLEKGKLADFVVLSNDIFKVEPMEIQNIKVCKTVVNGQICYDAEL